MTDLLPAIVSPQWLEAQLSPTDNSGPGPGAEGNPATATLKVVDVRSYLDGRSGHEAYLAGHIPGAVFVELGQVLAAQAEPALGRHPLPTPEVFAAGLGQAGIADDDHVVAYDDLGGMTAGRLVWMLRVLGRSAALLDGGLPAWPGPLEAGSTGAVAATRTVQAWPEHELADADEVVAAIADGGVVIDARAPERFRGEQEPIDSRAGHVPGAINLPFAANLGPDGRFLPTDDLGRRFAPVAAVAEQADAIVYCGSGVSACHNILAMEAAGLPRPRLFVGSWSQWSSDPSRPVATGAD